MIFEQARQHYTWTVKNLLDAEERSSRIGVYGPTLQPAHFPDITICDNLM